MKSLTSSRGLVTPRRPRSARPPSIGDLLNAITPALEGAGFEITRFDERGFSLACGDGRFVGEFRTRNTVVPPTEMPDDEVPYDDPAWDEEPARWAPLDDDRGDRDGVITLSPEEQRTKELLKPFSRNHLSPLDVRVLAAIGRAVESYDQLRREL